MSRRAACTRVGLAEFARARLAAGIEIVFNAAPMSAAFSFS